MKEVKELKHKGAIYPACQALGAFVSQLFLVPKNDRGQHPVRALNRYTQVDHFKMEWFHIVKELPQDWLMKVGLKDVYFLVPIHLDHHKYLWFQWEGQIYRPAFWPSCAPRIITKLMKPVVTFLRERGMRLEIYLEDMLLVCNA